MRIARTDLKKTDLMGNLEDLERYAETLKNKDVALVSIREVCTKLEGLVNKMDEFESGLDIFVGQSRMSLTNAPFSTAKLIGSCSAFIFAIKGPLYVGFCYSGD
jgi:hypothetical protein